MDHDLYEVNYRFGVVGSCSRRPQSHMRRTTSDILERAEKDPYHIVLSDPGQTTRTRMRHDPGPLETRQWANVNGAVSNRLTDASRSATEHVPLAATLKCRTAVAVETASVVPSLTVSLIGRVLQTRFIIYPKSTVHSLLKIRR